MLLYDIIRLQEVETVFKPSVYILRKWMRTHHMIQRQQNTSRVTFSSLQPEEDVLSAFIFADGVIGSPPLPNESLSGSAHLYKHTSQHII